MSNMPFDFNLIYMINQPVGVSLIDGRGASGILCNVTEREIYLLEYLYHTQFALKHYPLNIVQAVYPFPPCNGSGWVY